MGLICVFYELRCFDADIFLQKEHMVNCAFLRPSTEDGKLNIR